jgi:hypothetical protein
VTRVTRVLREITGSTKRPVVVVKHVVWYQTALCAPCQNAKSSERGARAPPLEG